MNTVINATTQQGKAIANKAPVNNTYVLKSQTIGFIEQWAKMAEHERNASNILIDDLYANGIKPTHFVAFNEGKDLEGMKFRDDVCLHIVIGYDSENMLKLWKADTKTLKSADQILSKALRETVRQDYNNLKSKLSNRIKQGDKKGKAPKSSDLDMIKKDLQSAINRIQKLTDGYVKSVDHVKTLKLMIADIK